MGPGSPESPLGPVGPDSPGLPTGPGGPLKSGHWKADLKGPSRFKTFSKILRSLSKGEAVKLLFSELLALGKCGQSINKKIIVGFELNQKNSDEHNS